MLVFGGAGLIGSYLFGKLGAKFPKLFIPLSCISLATAMLMMLPLSGSAFNLTTLSVLWGSSIIVLSLALQSKALNLASDATDVAMAIYSGLYNVGIGAGALIGGYVSLHYGLAYIGIWGGLLALLGCLLSIFLLSKKQF